MPQKPNGSKVMNRIKALQKKKKDSAPGPGQYDVGVAAGLIGANTVKEKVEDIEKRKKQNSF